MNRFDCSGSSGFGAGFRGMVHSSFHNGNLSCRGSLRQYPYRLRYRAYRSSVARLSTSCFIGESLAFCAAKRNRRASGIINAKPFAMAIAEIKFRQIAMQMRFADVLIDAINAAKPSTVLVVMMRLPS
jgi:hypothetical protein